jgi:TonB family protein
LEPTITAPVLARQATARLPQGTPLADQDVGLVLTIGADGKVTAVELTAPAGSPWDEAAIEAAKLFEFRPATLDGKPVPVRVPFTYLFRKPPRRGAMVGDDAHKDRREPETPPGLELVGEVHEMGSRTQLPATAITLRDPRTGRTWETVTDAQGRFHLAGLPPGELELEARTGEHRPRTRKVRAKARTDQAEVEIGLQPSGNRNQTIVQEQHPKLAPTEIDLTEAELRQVPGTFGDPTRVVATLPGVGRTPFGLGYYVVRGASFDNTGFFIDGHPAFFLYHLLGGPAVIHPELVGQLTFYPGGYPTKYGRFAAGVIAVETQEPPRDRWHLDVEIDVLKAAALFSVPFDDQKGEITLSLRRSYYELLLPLFVDGVMLSYTDYLGRISYEPVKGLKLTLMGLGAEDTLNQAGADQGVDLALGFHRIRAAAEWEATPDITWTNSAIWELEHTTSRAVTSSTDDIDVGLRGWFLHWRSFVELRPIEGFRLEAGADLLHGEFFADLRVPSLPALGDPQPPSFDPVIVHVEVEGPFTSFAPYFFAEWAPIPCLRFIPGLRLNLDMYGDGAHLTADPKLAARWEFYPGLAIKAMGSMTHQPPPLFQTETPFGDPSIPPVRGFMASLGLEWAPSEDWEVSVEGFYNHLINMARPSSALLDSEGNLRRTLWKADVQGRAWGLEVMVRKRFGDIFWGWLSYTFSRAERLRPPSDWVLFDLDQTHILNLAWSVDVGYGITIGARFQLVSGNPYFPITGAKYDTDRDNYQPRYAATADRLAPFHRLDLRIDKTWTFDDFFLSVYLDVQNVYNAANPESRQYSHDYKQEVDGAYIPILPTLGVRGQF